MARMAVLRHMASGIEYELFARHIVGRTRGCDLCIGDISVSGIHAEIRWDGHSWQVLDLGSRNGTFIDGRRLGPGEQGVLRDGAMVAFGGDDKLYCLGDGSPPRLSAQADDGTVVTADGDTLCLPSPDNCEVIILHEDDSWFIADGDGRRGLEDQDSVVAGGQLWQLRIPEPAARTRELNIREEPELAASALTFVVSRDGEHVELTLEHGGGTMPIRYRSHHTLLVELARRRALDIEQGQLPESECGWIYQDEILRDLKIEVGRMNLWIHRARQQLLSLGVRDGESLVERRPGSSQLRLGVSRVRISG